MTDPVRVQRVHELVKLAKAMPQGDFDRLMQFAQDLQVQRQGKRRQRYQTMSDRRPVQESWRIGN